MCKSIVFPRQWNDILVCMRTLKVVFVPIYFHGLYQNLKSRLQRAPYTYIFAPNTQSLKVT